MQAAVSAEYLRNALEAGLTFEDLADRLGIPTEELRLQYHAIRLEEGGARVLAVPDPPGNEKRRLEGTIAFREWPRLFLEEFAALEATATIPRAVRAVNERLQEPRLSAGFVQRRLQPESTSYDPAFAAAFEELELTRISYIEANLQDRAMTGSDAVAWKFLESRLRHKYGRKTDVSIREHTIEERRVRIETIRRQIVEQSATLQLTGGTAGAIEAEVVREAVAEDDDED